ncbi:MAG: hypothetical protein IPN64_15585 [Propionivibrio sp.]|uniref:hypothetical protein n=1 Tax=Propionivibrio sp. TaxID=2212460 RepID=UPI0025CCC68D|nr:hypothetical protein [Propionivibrio sp.]MBK8895390.1 hypothetical protein [Propionivibrio sp.]
MVFDDEDFMLTYGDGLQEIFGSGQIAQVPQITRQNFRWRLQLRYVTGRFGELMANGLGLIASSMKTTSDGGRISGKFSFCRRRCLFPLMTAKSG